MKKKGFTIVELVIVIAVIAVLAAVLIPVFSGVISKADKSRALRTAQNVIKNYAIDYAEKGELLTEAIIEVDEKYYIAVDCCSNIVAGITNMHTFDTVESAIAALEEIKGMEYGCDVSEATSLSSVTVKSWYRYTEADGVELYSASAIYKIYDPAAASN